MKTDIILEPDLTPTQIAELAQLAESLDFSTLWVQSYVRARDPFMSLVPAALATSKIRLGIMVVGPWEMHPLKIANALLTLNEYCQGRASLVVSGGAEWCGAIGADPVRRVGATRQTIEILRGAAGPDVFNYEGDLYKVRRGYNSKWATDTPPVLYVGAGREQMIRMSTKVADGFMMSDMPHTLIDEAVGWANDGCRQAGRPKDDFRISNFWAWHIKEDREEALREARRELMLRAWLAEDCLQSFLSPEDTRLVCDDIMPFLTAYRDRSGDIKGVPQRIVDELIENLTSTGTPEDIDREVERMLQFKTAGLMELGLRAHDDPAFAIRTIGERVLPALA